MKLIAELWGENIQLALGELRGILEGEGINYKIEKLDYPVLIMEADSHSPLKRAGLLRRLSKHIYSGKELPELNLELKDYAIRVRRKEKNNGPSNIERAIARGIKGRVNLTNPKNVVRVYVGEDIHIGIEIYDFSKNDYEARRAKNLPISYPITMHPRLSRAMINLARIPSNSRILDPFCGTGTILIEAALMGMSVYGSDIDERMIRATQVNLQKFNIQAVIEKKDVGEISGKYDAIITDPPYGRSSSTRGERIHKLYERAFKAFSEVSSKVVIALPSEEAVEIGKKYFHLEELYTLRVHKSLTRYFAYFRS